MNAFEEIINYFNEELKNALECVEIAIRERITEIRIRKRMPVSLVIRNTTYFIDYNGDLYDYVCHNAVSISAEDFDELVLRLCDYSIYSAMENMKNGYITIPNGSRIGIAGTCVCDDKGISSIKDITSLNIRIPRAVRACADKLLNALYVNSFPSIIVAGRPNSGKTTLLRDMALQLSNGFNGRYSKVTVVDERNEFLGKINDGFSTEIGVSCDVLTGYSKAHGIEIATRTLSPDIIICDEIATLRELESINYAFSGGVAFALSVHIGSRSELLKKPIIQRLLETRQFGYIALLDEHTYNVSLIDVSEVLCEINRNSDFNSGFYRDRFSTIL